MYPITIKIPHKGSRNAVEVAEVYTEEQIKDMLTNPERILMYRIWQEFKRFNDNYEQNMNKSDVPRTRKTKEE